VLKPSFIIPLPCIGVAPAAAEVALADSATVL